MFFFEEKALFNKGILFQQDVLEKLSRKICFNHHARANAEKWLDESINSVLAQNYDGPMEISFYNDASTDGAL